MGRVDKACQALGRALSIDRQRLGTMSVAHEAYVRLSIAKTLFAMGQWDLAAEEVNLAVQMSQKRGEQKRFSDWHSKEKKRALGGFLLPETISPENPACVKELHGYSSEMDHDAIRVHGCGIVVRPQAVGSLILVE